MPAYKDSNGKWYCQFYFEDWTGKKKHKVKRGFSTKKDAVQFERDFLARERNAPLTMTVLIDEYVKHIDMRVKMASLKESSAMVDKAIVKTYIKSYFHEVLVERIHTGDINKFFESLTYNKKGKRRASGTLHNIKRVLNQIFKYGIQNYDLKENPVTNMAPITPYSSDTRAKYWTVEQYKQFYGALNTEELRCIFNLLFFAGLRVNECLALCLADFSPYQVHIERTIAKTERGLVLQTPKTATSERYVQIPQKLYFQIVNYSESLYKYEPDEQLFLMSKEMVGWYLRDYAAKLKLPRISPHILRHSYATILYSKTHDILAVAAQIGHKNASITYNVYSHMLPEDGRAAADVMENLMLNSN